MRGDAQFARAFRPVRAVRADPVHHRGHPIRKHPRLLDGGHHLARRSRRRGLEPRRARASPARPRAPRGPGGLAPAERFRSWSRALAAAVRVRRTATRGAPPRTTARGAPHASPTAPGPRRVRRVRGGGERRGDRWNVRRSRGLPARRRRVGVRRRAHARPVASLVPKPPVNHRHWWLFARVIGHTP